MTAHVPIKSGEKFLYLVKLKGFSLFKIGVSSGDLTRLLQLNSVYRLDVESSFIVKCDDGEKTKRLESRLLKLTSNHPCTVAEFENKTGCTEIRNISCLSLVMDEISGSAEFVINPLSVFLSRKTFFDKKPVSNSVRLTHPLPFSPKDAWIYHESLKLAETRRISLAEHIRRFLMNDLKEAGITEPDKPSE